MAGDAKKLQPIIVKKIKKGGHAAHGGAWKIAYADFVTAMMAFFLLMWLLGSTTEGDKKGIADYFQSPLKLSLLNSGTGAGDATSIIKGGGDDLSKSSGHGKQGEAGSEASTPDLRSLKEEVRRAEARRLESLRDKIEAKLEENPRLESYLNQIKLDLTADGLRIQIVDEQNRAMFAMGNPTVQPYIRDLLKEIGAVLAEVPNRLTLEGHTDSTPYAGGQRGYSNWELSADRANSARRELLAGNMPEDRVIRVTGMAASIPFVEGDPRNPQNRRISILVMNREAEERLLKSAPAVADALNAPVPEVPSIRPAEPRVR